MQASTKSETDAPAASRNEPDPPRAGLSSWEDQASLRYQEVREFKPYCCYCSSLGLCPFALFPMHSLDSFPRYNQLDTILAKTVVLRSGGMRTRDQYNNLATETAQQHTLEDDVVFLSSGLLGYETRLPSLAVIRIPMREHKSADFRRS